MKRNLFILALVAAMFATFSSCSDDKKNGEIHFVIAIGWPSDGESPLSKLPAEGGTLPLPIAAGTYTGDEYEGLESVNWLDPEKLIVKIEGENFSLEESHVTESVRHFKLIIKENASTQIRKGKIIVTASKGKKTETLEAELTQLGASGDE